MEQQLIDYLGIRNAFHRLLVHDFGTAGLYRFTENFDRRGGFTHPERRMRRKQRHANRSNKAKPQHQKIPGKCARLQHYIRQVRASTALHYYIYERARMAAALDAQLYLPCSLLQNAIGDGDRHRLEMRVSFPNRGSMMRRSMRAWLHGMQDFLLRKALKPASLDSLDESLQQHLDPRRQQPTDDMRLLGRLFSTPSPIGFVIHVIKYRNQAATQNLALDHAKRLYYLMHDFPNLGRYFVGFDAAGRERNACPRDFVNAYQFLHSKRASHRPLPGKVGFDWGFTFHVGEDPECLLTDLRHLNETASLLFPTGEGGRLGHGLALAWQPEVFYGQRKMESERPLALLLLDLIWASGILRRINQPNHQIWRQDRIAKYTDAPRSRLDHCFEAMEVGPQRHAILNKQGLSEAELLKKLGRRILFDQQENRHRIRSLNRELADRRVTVKIDEHGLDLIRILQEHLRKDFSKQDNTIEANPTSNLVVGGFSDYKTLPYRQITDAGLPLTINTDDPGIFMTSLPGEFAALYQTLSDLKHSLRLTWLQQRLQDARQATFLPANPPLVYFEPQLAKEQRIQWWIPRNTQDLLPK